MSSVTPKNVHEVLGKYMLADGMDFVLDLRKSKGSFLYDSRSESKYLDFFTCFASLPIGFNHPKMTGDEFIRELGEIAVNKPSNSDLYTTELAEFVETFARVAGVDYLPHYFFVSGGGLAVENALKTAMDWKVRKNMSKGLDGEKGTEILHFKESFHGRTGYTLSLTNTADPRKYMYFARFEWPRVLNPKAIFPIEGENLDRVKAAEEESLKEIRNILKERRDDVAAIIIEPIQGEGGDNHFRREYIQELWKITRENEVLLIFDEVQSGMGLTGKWWAHQHYGVQADIIAFGKKSQVCGIMASDRVFEVEQNVFNESSRLNSTWGGNLIDMVRAKKYLEIIEEENLVENAAVQGEYLLEKLHEIMKNSDGRISNVRGKGLMIAFDFANSEKRDAAIGKIKEEGVLVLPCGFNSIRLRPPLNVSREEADMALEAFEKAIKNI